MGDALEIESDTFGCGETEYYRSSCYCIRLIGNKLALSKMVEITTIFSKIIISIRVFGYHSTYLIRKTPILNGLKKRKTLDITAFFSVTQKA